MKRIRSLAIDNYDNAILRENKRIDENVSVMGNFHQPCPMFFTGEGANLNMEGSFRGAAAFLVAAGPSFAEVDKTPLGRVWAMTLNNACASWRGQANCTVDEPSRFNLSMWLDPTVQKFVPMAHFEKPLWDNRLLRVEEETSNAQLPTLNAQPTDRTPDSHHSIVPTKTLRGLLADSNLNHQPAWRQRWEQAAMKLGDCPNVIGYRRNEKFHAPRFLHEETVNWGNHKKYGGGRSVLLAALRILFLLGFRRVYLLGVDFEMTPGRKYHFVEDRSEAAIRNNTHTYGRLQEWLGQVQPYFLKEKYVVKNCNPSSRLTAFPFMPYAEAIDEATEHLGDYARERTEGMYRKLEEKAMAVQADAAPG